MASNVEVVGIGSCTVDYFAIVPRLLAAEEKINATRMAVLLKSGATDFHGFSRIGWAFTSVLLI